MHFALLNAGFSKQGRASRPRLEHPGGHLCVGALGFDLEVPEAQTIGPRSVPILILTSVVAAKRRRVDGEETFEEYGVMIKF